MHIQCKINRYQCGTIIVMKTTTENRSRPGPVPGPETKKCALLIDPDLVEWGKHQPGGLSNLVRHLLRQAKQDMERA